MKVWRGFGSEHSANLRMIGHFKTADDASLAERQLQQLCELAMSVDLDSFDENPMAWYLDEPLRRSLQELGLYQFSAEDIASLVGEHLIERHRDEVRIRTEEIAVSGLIKFLIEKHARIEVYSAHDYPDSNSPQT